MRRRWPGIVAWVVVVGTMASSPQWFEALRPPPPALRASSALIVTSSADDGPGSLRDALYTAAATAGRVRITLPPSTIVVATPLPPVVNAAGVVLVGTPGATVLDAAALDRGPVLDIDAPASQIEGVTFRRAPEQALVIRGSGVTIQRATFEQCDQGIYAAAGVDRLLVEQSRFTGNRLGVTLGGDDSRATLRGNQFGAHVEAAVWGVRRDPRFATGADHLVVVENRFERDRVAIVVGNLAARVESNELIESQQAAIVLIGEGVVVRGNRVRGGHGIGVIVDDAHGAVIDGNEIDQNAAIGILVRASGAAVVQRNRLQGNGYGIAFVLGRPDLPSTGLDNTLLRHRHDGVIVVGDSPVLRRNRVLRSRLAALRVLDFHAAGQEPTVAEPLLDGNVLEGNTFDHAVRGRYQAETGDE